MIRHWMDQYIVRLISLITLLYSCQHFCYSALLHWKSYSAFRFYKHISLIVSLAIQSLFFHWKLLLLRYWISFLRQLNYSSYKTILSREVYRNLLQHSPCTKHSACWNLRINKTQSCIFVGSLSSKGNYLSLMNAYYGNAWGLIKLAPEASQRKPASTQTRARSRVERSCIDVTSPLETKLTLVASGR